VHLSLVSSAESKGRAGRRDAGGRRAGGMTAEMAGRADPPTERRTDGPPATTVCSIQYRNTCRRPTDRHRPWPLVLALNLNCIEFELN